MKIVLIDNYDSFTFNLYHYLSSIKNVKVDVIRNDKINSKDIIKKKYNKIVISPGPGNPKQSGNCIKIVKDLHKRIPILGVCLGHQIIGEVFGSKVVQAQSGNFTKQGVDGSPTTQTVKPQDIQGAKIKIDAPEKAKAKGLAKAADLAS